MLSSQSPCKVGLCLWWKRWLKSIIIVSIVIVLSIWPFVSPNLIVIDNLNRIALFFCTTFAFVLPWKWSLSLIQISLRFRIVVFVSVCFLFILNSLILSDTVFSLFGNIPFFIYRARFRTRRVTIFIFIWAFFGYF